MLLVWGCLLAIVAIYWLICGVIFLVTVVILKIDDEAKREKRRLRQQRREEEERQRIKDLYAELVEMTCANEAVKADVRALPARKKTVHLGFLDLKRQVCRPFAK